MEQEEYNRKCSSLVCGLFRNNYYGKLLAHHGYPDEFVVKSAKREDVINATKQFIDNINNYLEIAEKEQSKADAIQQNNYKDCSIPLNEQRSSEPSYNCYTNSKIVKEKNVKLLEPKIFGNTSALTPTQQTVSLSNQSSQANNSTVATTLATSQQMKPDYIPVSQPSKTQPNIEQPRAKFFITSNGKVNEPFHGKIEWKPLTVAGKKLILHDVKIPEEIGLSFDVDNQVVQGTPVSAGDYKLKIHYHFEQSTMSKPEFLEGDCILIVNPDPKTLWKQEPSDQNDPYWKKDEDSITIQGDDGLSMIAVSKRGRSHAHVGSFRDDDFCLLDPNGWRILTVADGAGSAKKSRKGSLIASHKASEYVSENLLSMESDQKFEQALTLWNNDKNKATKLIKDKLYELFGQAALVAVRAIDEEAQFKGFPCKDYSTTLLMAVHKKFSIGHFVGAYWLGDGGIGLYRQGKEIQVLGKADSGEFAGQTRFLDKEMVSNAIEIYNRINFTIIPDFTALVVMTDGITDPHFETDANLENIEKWDNFWEKIEPYINGINPEKDMLSWLDFWIQGNHDDRTIALLCTNKLSNASINMGVLHE